jgi:hypothetical protein
VKNFTFDNSTKKKTITMYESGAQKSCIQKTNAIFSIYKVSEQQKLGKIQKVG